MDMHPFDETTIQPVFESAPTPAPRRSRALLAVAAGLVAVAGFGGTLALTSGGDDAAADAPTEVAGVVLLANDPAGPTVATGATGAVEGRPPAPNEVKTTHPAGEGPAGTNGGGSPTTVPPATVPPTTVPPTTVPPTTVPPTTVPPAPGAAQLVVAPLSLNYGMSTGTRSVTVKNPGGVALQWSATPDKAWLTVSPKVGTVQPGQEVQLEVKATPAGAPGTGWSGGILFNSNGGSFAMPVSGTFKLVLVDGLVAQPLPVKPALQSVTVPGLVCKNAPIAVVAKLTGDVTTVKVERTLPNATTAMNYDDATHTASKVLVAPGFASVVKITVRADGPGGSVESAAHDVVVSPFC